MALFLIGPTFYYRTTHTPNVILRMVVVYLGKFATTYTKLEDEMWIMPQSQCESNIWNKKFDCSFNDVNNSYTNNEYQINNPKPYPFYEWTYQAKFFLFFVIKCLLNAMVYATSSTRWLNSNSLKNAWLLS